MGDVSQMKDETGRDLADSLGVIGDLVYDTKKLVKELNSDVAEQTRLLEEIRDLLGSIDIQLAKASGRVP